MYRTKALELSQNTLLASDITILNPREQQTLGGVTAT